MCATIEESMSQVKILTIITIPSGHESSEIGPEDVLRTFPGTFQNHSESVPEMVSLRRLLTIPWECPGNVLLGHCGNDTA